MLTFPIRMMPGLDDLDQVPFILPSGNKRTCPPQPGVALRRKQRKIQKIARRQHNGE